MLRRVVGLALIAVGFVLGIVAEITVPDSDPQLGGIAILVMVECLGWGIALAGSVPKAHR